ncbi:MAG: dTDP-4-dehydrorhamnose reductase [Sulfuricellaceae bacterium]|nr:dTDP-4-dehydrorhamnose reductase [Sulfuricellaceae bacterium]
MKKILLVGKNGQVGWELQRTLAPLGHVIARDSRELDLSVPDAIRDAMRDIRPDLVVNAAAYTAVDKAESEPGLAWAINGDAPGILAEEAKRLNALLVHYSTDYVFDGTQPGAYTEQDTPKPQSVYGQSKLAGEQAVQASGCAHLILRTSWVYGGRGKNFLLTMLRLAREKEELSVVDDQIGAPTWSRLIAETTAQILAQRQSSSFRDGLYHLTAAGETSWHGFAQAIFAAARLERLPRLRPIPSSEYPLPAPRPKNSVLANDKLLQNFGLAMPHWQQGLSLCLEGMA